MTFELKKTTTTMENGTTWPYGYPSYEWEGFGDLEKSIGDAKAQLLMQLGDSEARVSDAIAAGQYRLGDSMATGHAHITAAVTSGDSAILREVDKVGCDVLSKIGDTTCDVLTKVGDAECNIIKEVDNAESKIVDRMGTYAQDNFKNQSDIAFRASNQLNSVERDLQNRIHENRFVLSKEIADHAERLAVKSEKISDKSDAQFADLKNQLRYFETSVAKQFCHIETEGLKNTSRILETLAANKYDALKDEVDAIRADRYADKYGFNFALQNQELAYLKQMIGSVENNQRFGSKTVQFGAGNQAGTAQTANQG